VQAGQIYAFRARGPFEPARGLRFDPSKLLLDPYGRAIAVPKNYSRDAARQKGDNTATAMKSVVTDPHAYDWEMHVDGFRFDLASILARDSSGSVMPNPPMVWDIESDPALAGAKMIAEAWDAAGLYQVGNFVGDSWKEWNDRFRDDIRDFFRGANGSVARAADRLIGSASIYGPRQRELEQSINFVSCHDGFTLNDIVSYNQKYNKENGENNRDGCGDNRSWNCGFEGATDDPAIEKLRNRQVKNFLTACYCPEASPCFSWATRCGAASAATTTPTARTTTRAGSIGICCPNMAMSCGL
jgi:pullulanase/glycogen debranching enzyme